MSLLDFYTVLKHILAYAVEQIMVLIHARSRYMIGHSRPNNEYKQLKCS